MASNVMPFVKKGYTFNFNFWNMPAPTKYTRLVWSPLHARMLSLFDCLQPKYHRFWMDNLYLSAKFCKGYYMHPNKMLLSGVVRNSGRGILLSVLQVTEKQEAGCKGLGNFQGCTV
jgi:hypothetical protein